MARIRLKLLGGFTAQRADGTAIMLPTRKTEALLAVLACRPGEKRQREWLMALLWGDRGDVQARHSLNQALTSIRRACDGTLLLVTERDGVTLDGATVEIDVAELRRQAGSGSLAALRAAAALYRGPLLDGLRLREAGFEEWLGQERRELHDLTTALLVDLAEQEAAGGDREAAAAVLDRALALDPLNEALHRRVIRLHLDDGAYNAAIRHSRQCAELLKRELATVPEPATTALHRQALAALAKAPVLARPTAPVESAPCPAAAADAPAESAGLPAERRRPSIAVMPFGGAGPGLARDELADGLAHDIICRLAKLRSLFVIARGSVFALGERGIGAEEAGRLLKVDYVVSGSVRRQGNGIAVIIELAETATGTIIWTDALHRKVDDTLMILDELGNRIVAAIAGEIEQAERNRAVLKPPSSLDAWEAYHRGLWHMYRFNAADNDEAHHFFAMAARLDPTFARAYAGLSFTHFQNAFLFRRHERGPESDRAFETAGQGLIIDDRDPGVHWAMGRALWLRGRPDQALVELDTAVDLSPNFALGHYQLAFVQCQTGDPRAAIASAD